MGGMTNAINPYSQGRQPSRAFQEDRLNQRGRVRAARQWFSGVATARRLTTLVVGKPAPERKDNPARPKSLEVGDGAAALRFPERRPNRQQHTLGDAAGTFADPTHLGLLCARVHLDDLRLYADRHPITGETPKNSIKRCGQGHGANLGDLLTLPNCITDAGFCAEDAIERSVDVTVACMPGDLPWLTGENAGCAVRDDDAESFPTGLDHHISVSSGHEVWAKP